VSCYGQSRSLLNIGFLDAAQKCLSICGDDTFEPLHDASVKGGSSKVDYVALVGGEERALIEAKSPSVMRRLGELLPDLGFTLTWQNNSSESLEQKILTNVSTLSIVLLLFLIGYL
jgi:hypothetical protein